MRRVLVSTALGLAVLGGCSTPTERPPVPATTAVASPVSELGTLTCAGSIDGDPPPSGYQTVLGVVALPSEALGASDSGDPATPALFAKTGLVIRAGRPFEIDVTPQPDDRVAIGWSNSAFLPAARFVVPSCPDTYGTGWLAYPGGYWVDRPLCLPLTVHADGREQQVRIGVGTACPGQAPPPSR